MNPASANTTDERGWLVFRLRLAEHEIKLSSLP